MKAMNMNVIVVDVQPRLPDAEFMKAVSDFHRVARVVVWPDGLDTFPAPPSQMNAVLDQAERAGRAGFQEVQLDYIRFADRVKGDLEQLSQPRREQFLHEFLKSATDRLRPLGVDVGADIFGRIAFNYRDRIGQSVEGFSPHLDVLYPMLYPSHFYGEPKRIADPYTTLKEGTESAKRRSGNTRVVAYIQGFTMSVPTSMNLQQYIYKQIAAVHDAGTEGFVVWNPRNKYDAFFKALQEYQSQHGKRTAGP
jgi:hypothetical protein